MVLPEKVILTEVGPRDGLQMEQVVLSTEQKVTLIASLAAAGLTAVQVGSFVHPLKVPQMADTDAVIAQLSHIRAIDFSALTLNQKGVERACKTSVPWIEVSLSASEKHSLKNSGMSVDQARQQVAAMIDMAREAGRKVRGSIQCAFGCVYGCEVAVSDVLRLAGLMLDRGVDLLVLADTTGMGTPLKVRRMLEDVLSLAQNLPVGLHLHDTRGLGLVNLTAGLEMGVLHFDTSLGGLGGCPFVKGAAGNIATEDTLHLLGSWGIATGVDIEKVARCSRDLSDILNHPLSGKMYKHTDFSGENCAM